MGPSVLGVEECRGTDCRRGGGFLSAGANIELRARLFRYLYAQLRVLAGGNIVRERPLYDGIFAPGLGLGGYFHRAFIRAEYLVEVPFGSPSFVPPWGRTAYARDEWKHHAAMISAGGRLPVAKRLAVELWGGVVIGPRSTRDLREPLPEGVDPGLDDERPETRTLVSFIASLGVSYDVLP
jgi:hypothetical protein